MSLLRSRVCSKALTSHHAVAGLQKHLMPLSTLSAFKHKPTTHSSSTSQTPIQRLQQVQRQFSTTAMAQTNNQDFEISEVFNVKDKVAIITGGGTGIGLMATQALAVNGAKVYIIGREQEKLDNAIKAHGQNISGQIIGIQADISKKSEIARLVKEISAKESHLDVLINNAGIDGATLKTEVGSGEEAKKNLFDAEESTFEDWTNIYETNVTPLFFTTTAFLPLLAKATEKQKSYSGTVINISSISGMVQQAQHHFNYNASKAAAIHLTRMLAHELTQANGLKVRINSIAPGVFPSEMTTGESDENQKSELEKSKYEKVPARRPGNDRDMAGAIIFAVTNQYLNGQTIAVDGGYTLMAGQ